MTPLHHAAKKTTTAAAELMKFLLLSGANPNTSALVRGKTLTPSMERGARNISKWLGMTWDELVKWAQEDRKKRSQNDEGSVAE
jgi:ankyrin repeat protein